MNANDLSDSYYGMLQNDAMENQSLTPGIYLTERGVYKVQAGKQNPANRYAKIHDGHKFQYVSGAIYQLNHSDKLTLSQARAIGKAIGSCVKCGAELTDQKSVERGIGPVCEKRWAA